MKKMELHNDTLLRGFLSHLQSNAREMAALRFEYASHQDARSAKPLDNTRNDAIREKWETLSRDLVRVIGPAAALKPYGRLVEAGSFACQDQHLGRDPFRITLKALKKLADKARRRHPDIALLKSWDITAKERPESED